MNKRVFISRKQGFDIERLDLISTFKENYSLDLASLKYYLVYDVFNIEDELYSRVLEEIFTEVNRDSYSYDTPKANNIIAYESLPGQFDQRSDSAEQCIRLVEPQSKAIVKSGIVITFDEEVSDKELQAIKKYLINSVESREKDLTILDMPETNKPISVPVYEGFIKHNQDDLEKLYKELQLAMSLEDFAFIQSYFKQEERNPYETEIKVLDTYWSDHCRHTTFETEIVDVDFEEDVIVSKIENSFKNYLKDRMMLRRDSKPVTLMDLATINSRKEKFKGNLNDIEISEEINAASIYITVDVNGIDEKWLLMFKNETHNHPTEIEPFGGASTCIGGAIRDPLSGRSYVYSAMRVTGASDINESIKDTMEGKLPQKVISKEAAHGYSSYGNQIGLATTFVDEIYHDGYKAKRMEIGAVVGAVKAEYVRRETPCSGDIILLLGGRTGRDGIGGATGSSKEHTKESLDVSSAEVQKGNAPEERKIQRLFRNPDVTKLIKKSNDFGAGGVSVAVGELADGLLINLDNVPTKYQGIYGTELAISESQERMAVVVDKTDVEKFKAYCYQENIEVSEVAVVTDEKRLVMTWQNKVICDMSREFIDTSGVRQKTKIKVVSPDNKNVFAKTYEGSTLEEQTHSMLKDKNIASQQGLVEMFDSSIGRTTVLSPYGGKFKLTKTQTSIHKLPVQNGVTNTVSMMSYGFNPYVSEWSPYHGAAYAVIESMSKVVASGGNHKSIRFTFQEYFERLNKRPELGGKPLSALLGAYETLSAFNLPAIGGKDSMSGTYHDISVPPTLVSFAVTTSKIDQVISPEFKKADSYIYLIDYDKDQNFLPNYHQLDMNYTYVTNQISESNIISAYALGYGGIQEALIKMSFGNKIGFNVTTKKDLFSLNYGAIIVESAEKLNYANAVYLGETIKESVINVNGTHLLIDDLIKSNQSLYNKVYPIEHTDNRVLEVNQLDNTVKPISCEPSNNAKVLIPVFPGTNCEYDCEKAFKKEGADVEMFVFNNQTPQAIEASINNFEKAIDRSNIIMFAGGFSSGDEPDGSGKFIASILRNNQIKLAIDRFLSKRFLILGICNGFQALVKAGLLPLGNVTEIKENSPTLFKNTINRHIARFANTRVSSLNSPWLSSFDLGEVHSIPMSHGEGKFMIDEEGYQSLIRNNQIAFQYVDDQNNPTYNPTYNPNGSSYAIEGIVSKDGLILGKMGHSERFESGLFKNIPGNKEQNIFKNGVEYIRRGSMN